MLFKINGERNSGTTFLYQLIKTNFGNVIEHENIYETIDNKKHIICKYWKHGVPSNTIKTINDRVIDIFIFRNLEEWFYVQESISLEAFLQV